jgi:hypothetical protein
MFAGDAVVLIHKGTGYQEHGTYQFVTSDCYVIKTSFGTDKLYPIRDWVINKIIE